ncbi:type VI secretion system-associated FHA domain protein TagH [Thiocystis violacea]|uniref:type VI secretion system-associated FHA domain protein TagH n=1 Tax=Thiocystis violacea TaxID=13725 RepID=UPI001904CCC2|nr:type VI secretion system-associated FHA domain protein TagH [Thiocystis violacea]MBK1717789.1 hypothetical protein [Thiocystis violacea]
MELTLRVMSRQDQRQERQVELTLTERGITIGRGLGNDLCLEDPERVVSGQHARIDPRDGGVWVTDTSRNGTYLNDAEDPIPAHQAVALYAGDRLGIGPYDVLVSFGVETVPARHPEFELQSDALDADRAGLAPVGAATDILDLLDPGSGHADLLPDLPPDTGQSSNRLDDPFADASALDEHLAGPAPEAPPRGAPHHHTPVEHVFYRPADRQGVPEDYDLLNDVWREPDPEPVAMAFEPAPGEPEPELELEPTPPPETPPPWASDRTDPMPVLGEPEPVAPPRRPEPPRPKPFAVGAPAGGELRAFLDGLGCARAPVPEDPEAFLRDSGELLRALANGLVQTMMVRARFKSELRLGVTTIRAAENNPFKFSVGADDILDRLLFRPTPGFIPPVAAAREAFEDIQAHEMAMTAGLQAALRALVARFEPGALERRLAGRSGLDQVLPMARKAKYWDLFTEAYEQVAADAAEDFMQLFDDAFASAYQEQIERLRAARGAPRPRG